MPTKVEIFNSSLNMIIKAQKSKNRYRIFFVKDTDEADRTSGWYWEQLDANGVPGFDSGPFNTNRAAMLDVRVFEGL